MALGTIFKRNVSPISKSLANNSLVSSSASSIFSIFVDKIFEMKRIIRKNKFQSYKNK